jgi:SAM-dependent methyltransferase
MTVKTGPFLSRPARYQSAGERRGWAERAQGVRKQCQGRSRDNGTVQLAARVQAPLNPATGAFALLERFERFERADAIALGISAQLLHRLRGRAHDLGVADRVRTVQADLDAAWPAIDTVDLVRASSSLHHVADPDLVLTEVFAALHPGGLLVVVEMDSFPRFLPDALGLGRPGLEARCHAALAAGQAAEVPHLGSDWGSRLSQVGFAIEAERPFASI